MAIIYISDAEKLVELTLAGVQTTFHFTDTTSWPDEIYNWWYTPLNEGRKEDTLLERFNSDLRCGGRFSVEVE